MSTLEISVANTRVSVRLVDGIVCNGQACCGTWDPQRREILIDASLDFEARMGTLRHEIAEAAFDLSGLSELHSPEVLEAIVKMCENILIPSCEGCSCAARLFLRT